MAAIVVQLGLATMPLGMFASAWALTSDTTRGTSGSMRHAEELSTTMAPAAATRGAIDLRRRRPRGHQRDVDPREVRGIGVFDDDRATVPLQRRTRRSSRTEEPYVVSGELAFGQNRPHDRADLTRGPDDRYSHDESLGLGRVEAESGVQRAHRVGDLVGLDDARDADRTGRDHVDVDAVASTASRTSAPSRPGSTSCPRR